MQSLKYKIVGAEPLLMNNPQTVDPFNPYSKLKKEITAKRNKTEEDLLRLRMHEVESKIYFDDKIGVYIPSSWMMAAISGMSWAKAKIKKAEIRSCVFPVDNRIKLDFKGMKKVKSKKDISGNDQFFTVLLLKQGQVKLPKCAPIFYDWSFDVELHFDKTIIDESSLKDLVVHSAKYGGFGDFRPTYGRASVEF